MRNIATCYSEHAVKVSDSYCSAVPLTKSYVSPKTSFSSSSSSLSSSSASATQTSIICSYKIKITQTKHLIITITWSNKLICQGFWLNISEKVPSLPSHSSKTPNTTTTTRSTTHSRNHHHHHHQLHRIKGTKSIDSCKSKIQVFYDLSNAKFDSLNPQPQSQYYIIILIDSQVGLLLGDMEFDPIVKDITIGLPVLKSALVSQCEHFAGSSSSSICSTKAKFCDSGSSHDIQVKFCGEDEESGGVDGIGSKYSGPVLSVSIDNKKVVRVRRLKWNFRGNQVIFIDGLLIDVMWDLHGWLFNDRSSKSNSSNGNGVVMLRTRSGLDSRLWLEEQSLADNNNNKLNHDNKVEFSFLVCAGRKNHPAAG